MSETVPGSNIIETTLPADLDRYGQLDMRTYKNGARHVYGINSEGKKEHISHDDVLEAYGHDPADSRKNWNLRPGDTDEVTPVPGPEFTPSVELARMEGRLIELRSDYAELTAKSRKSYLGRFLKGNTRVGNLLRKIKPVAAIMNKVQNSEFYSNHIEGKAGSLLNNNDIISDKATQEAQAAYEAMYNEVSALMHQEMIDAGIEADEAKSWSIAGNIFQDAQLEKQIVEKRQSQGKSTNKFVNWWVSANGWKGKLAKAGIVVAAGAITGLTAGVAAGPMAAWVAGGATGGLIARHVTQRRANSVDESGITLAQRQSDEDHSTKVGNIVANHEDTARGTGSVEDITGATESRTDDEMLGNRRRMRTAVVLGGTGAKAAMFGRNWANTNIFDKPKVHGKTEVPADTKVVDKTPKPTKTGHTVVDAQPAPRPATPEVPRPRFDVEPGSGFEREISQYFANNGKPISGSEAHKLYQSLEQTYGPNGLIKPSATYLRSGTDFGISRPGMYEVADGPAKILSDWLAAK